MTVIHFDGDLLNCAATNVAWRIDPAWLARQRRLETLAIMPQIVRKRPSRGNQHIIYLIGKRL
jgi:hypothetical protein